MKKFVTVFSSLLLFGGMVVLLLWSLFSPSTASDSAGNVSPQLLLTVGGMMLLGLFGFAMTDDGKGGGSGPPCMWG